MMGHTKQEHWFRRHLAVIVTVALAVLALAVAWGGAISRISSAEDAVVDVRGDVVRGDSERGDLRQKVAVHDTWIQHLDERATQAAGEASWLVRMVTRLEAIITGTGSTRPP